jgi:ABC-type molybdenum transport system ATPase subunit/photorepair protein PhrA
MTLGAMERAPIVELRQVARDFFDGRQDRRVLFPLDLVLRQNELTIISGPSGSGKTTLLTIMALIQRPSQGDGVAGTAGYGRVSGNQRQQVVGKAGEKNPPAAVPSLNQAPLVLYGQVQPPGRGHQPGKTGSQPGVGARGRDQRCRICPAAAETGAG